MKIWKKNLLFLLSVVMVVSLLPKLSFRAAGSPPDRPYSIREDGWGFINSREGVVPSIADLDILSLYRQEFGDTYVAAATTNHGNFQSMVRESWGGSCSGMSISSILLYLGKIDWNDYNTYNGNVFDTVNEYYEQMEIRDKIKIKQVTLGLAMNSAVQKLINCLQYSEFNTDLYQLDPNLPNPFTEYFMEPASSSGWLKSGVFYDMDPNGNYIQNVYETACNTEIPLLVTITYSNPLTGNNISHAIVLRTDRRPEDMGNGWYRMYVYDPNRPWFPEVYLEDSSYRFAYFYINNDPEDSYIELNPSENKWRYSLYGGKNSKDPDFIGCDADGNVRYMQEMDSLTGEVVYSSPEYLTLFDLSGVDDCIFDGKDRRWFGADPSIGDQKSQFIVYGRSDISLPDGTPLLQLLDSGTTLSLNSDFSLLGDESPQFGSSVFPYSDLVFECYGDNDLSIADGNNVISFAGDGRATVTVSMRDNSVRIQNQEDGDVLVKITDLSASDGYTSVYADGKLSSGDDVVLSLKDDRFEMTGSVSETSGLNLFTNNGTVPAEKYFTLFDSENHALVFDNVRDIDFLSLQGTVVSVGESEAPVLVRLLKDGYEIAKVEATDGQYFFDGIVHGTYSLEVSRTSFCPEIREVTVGDADTVQNVELHLLGDVNGDGKVNSSDAVTFARYLAKWSISLENPSAADINRDGEISGSDAVLLSRYLAKWDVPNFG